MAIERNSHQVTPTFRTALYATLIATVAIFSIGSIYFFTRFQEQERNLSKRADAAMWLVTSLEREYWKLLDALAQHIRLADDGSQALLQYEVFWSRLLILTEGDEGQPVRTLEGYRTAATAVSNVLGDIEPAFQALEVDGRPVSVDVLEQLHTLRLPIHDFVVHAHLQKAWRTDLSSRLLTRQRLILYACFAGIVVSGAALLLLLFRHVSLARRLLHSLNQALAEAEHKTHALSAEMDQRKIAEHELREANKELVRGQHVLKQSNEELQEYSHIIAHDLKEPLRGISVYSAFLLERFGDCIDESGREMLAYQSAMVRQLDALINNLQSYSRFGVTSEMTKTEVSLDQVLEQIVESLQVLINERNVELLYANPLPTIRCDRILVAEVLRNILVNAISYNENSPVRIEIGSNATSDGTHTIFIKDNGIGIDTKHREAIFKLFKRLHGKNEYGGGTGYGLTLSKKIVQRHGGRIWVESTPGEGSCFYFTLSKR